ncbi:MAG: N-acetyl sugar amidotransferase [Saprospiraceae bacterium]|nr:N-acetyl sugar amidotransferase [Saprospiraceae bacterium]
MKNFSVNNTMILTDKDPGYRQCSMSVMDNIADPNITFDRIGVCNYYLSYKASEKKYTLRGDQAELEIKKIIELLKKNGIGKKYDCILGVSGGIDSTFLAYKAKQYGLKVLCVHFDNGWNSQEAVSNIENIVSKCEFDLFTYVIDWEEFRDIQLSYFKADVIDIEAITDIAIISSLNKICSEHKLKYILDGTNIWTEETLPSSWINKNPNNLFAIHQKFGMLKLNKFPAKFKKGKYLPAAGNYSTISLLNYLDYNKSKTKEIISKELGWQDYGGKHYESVFTRFYQGYILPVKFRVDKRKAHLSNLIFSGQITKEEALMELAKPSYPPGQLEIDKPFVLKKLGFSEESFNRYMERAPVPHEFYLGKLGMHKSKLKILRETLGRVKRKIF